MNTETELAHQLERSLDDLPTVPATTYLHQAKLVRRRRRAAAGLVAASVLVVASGGLMAVTAPGGDTPGDLATNTGRELVPVTMPSADLPADPDYPAPEPANPVEAVDGLAGVDSYSTTKVPSWAQEYGNHGPVAIAPDGRLWVAPEAVVRRTVVDPMAGTTLGDGTRVTESFAVEARFEDDDNLLGDVVWVLIYNSEDVPGSFGEMDEPGRWTDDFELWVDDVTSRPQGRPDFASRLVDFTDDSSDVLVPRDGVQVVRQLDGVELGPTWAKHPRSSVAEVRWAGKTWFVLAQGPRNGSPFFDAYDPGLSAPDLEGFVTWLRGDGS